MSIEEIVFDIISTIKDPEFPSTLAELNIVDEDWVTSDTINGVAYITIEWQPTIPKCSLALNIGLSMRYKLLKEMSGHPKINLFIKEGTHEKKEESRFINSRQTAQRQRTLFSSFRKRHHFRILY